ncbi:MAG: class I SAM-dependent methyltransferase [Deltaproteobacteria bacterium]|nr:class I SAM-dependent methyltransferase [Deltaproteobacteria bacterium]
MSLSLDAILLRALQARSGLRDPQWQGALRLFNGFLEGNSELAVDLFARTAVVHDHAASASEASAQLATVETFVREHLPEVRALLVKSKQSADPEARRGVLRFGTSADLDRRVRENGVAYALDLRLNQDASLYLDTRELRAWAKAKLADQIVLNTFAYTGSLGVAARAAPAKRVVQTDLNRAYLNLAKDSYALNRWPVVRSDFRGGDFFEVMGELKRQGALFDCVFVDPPFFSTTDKGTVDLEKEFARLLNKVRPLVGDGGRLVAVNNALFVSGAEYQKQLQSLCADGYLELDELIPAPADFVGFPETRVGAPPADPAPFNHSTKIAVLRAKRKDGKKASG